MYRTVITADYVYTRVYHDWIRLNSNLLQNPNNPEFNYSPATRYTAGQATICPGGGVTQDATYTTSSLTSPFSHSLTSINFSRQTEPAQFITPCSWAFVIPFNTASRATLHIPTLR